MKKQRKLKGPILISLVLALCCLLFFPNPAVKDLVLKPAWALELGEKKEMPGPGKADLPLTGFRIADTFGYVDPVRGRLYFLGRIQHNITLSSGGFINYSSVQTADQSLVYFSPTGEFLASYQLTGYPLLSRDGNRLFIFRPDGLGISEIDPSGEVIWQAAFTKIITTAAIGSDLICLGFSNGLLQLYDREGVCVYEYRVQDSEIPVILGCALDKEQDRLALVAGINPQYLVCIEKSDKNYLDPYYYPLDTNFRKEVYMEFSGNSQYLLLGSDEWVMNFTLKNKKGHRVPIEGQLVSISISDKGDLFSIVSAGQDMKFLSIFRPENSLIIKESFQAVHCFHKFLDNQLILGLDDVLLKFDIMEI